MIKFLLFCRETHSYSSSWRFQEAAMRQYMISAKKVCMFQLLNLHPRNLCHIHSLELIQMQKTRPYFLLLRIVSKHCIVSIIP